MISIRDFQDEASVNGIVFNLFKSIDEISGIDRQKTIIVVYTNLDRTKDGWYKRFCGFSKIVTNGVDTPRLKIDSQFW